MKDFDIEINDQQNPVNGEAGSIQLPLNFLSFGEIEPDDVKVYIKQDVYKALEKYASSDTTKELGTILIGDYCEDLGKLHVIISDYIEAKYTDASASTLTFTHETWDYIHKEHDRLYPTKKIIGWQHTHPNYGIFLSNYDLFIQDNFFNMPFQVAYVIDPLQNIRGFFQWKNGKTEKLNGYYIYDEVGKPIKIEQKKLDKDAQVGKKSPNKLMIGVIAVLCAIVVALSGVAINVTGKYKEQLKLQADAQVKIQEQEDTINEQKQDIDALQTQLADGILGSDIDTVQELIARIENDEIKVQNKQETLLRLKNLVNSINGDNGNASVRFVTYTVEEGDSLWGICDEYGLDYQANHNIILTLNGITDPNAIYVGQVLVVPTK